MKIKYMRALVLFFALAFYQSLSAQVEVNWNEVVVTDSSGKVYGTADWQGLLTTGKYSIQLSADRKKASLIKLSEEESSRRLAALPQPQPSRYFKTGEKISSFEQKDIHGNKFDLKKLAGKVVVLNFWFINCPPCRQEIPGLNEIVASFRDNKEVVFIAVALDQKTEIEKFLVTTPYNYHIIDNGGPIANQYGITSYPTHVVVDKEGKIAFHTTGLSLATVPWLKRSIGEAVKK